MKRLALVLAVAVSLGWTSSCMWAQEGADAPKPQKRETKKKPKPKKPLLRGEYAMMARACQLSEDQQKKIAELVPQRHAALQEFNEKRKAAKVAMTEARKSKDAEAMKKAQAAGRALNAEYEKLSKEWWEKILSELDPEQKAKWQEFTFMRQVSGRMPGVKLTEDQREKVKAAYVEHTTGADLANRKVRAEAVGRLAAHIIKNVLTDTQRVDMLAARILGRYRRAKLTDEQVQQVKAACAEQLKGLDPSDEKALKPAMTKLVEQINTTILTDEQREKIQPKREPKPGAKKERKEPKVRPAKPAKEPEATE